MKDRILVVGFISISLFILYIATAANQATSSATESTSALDHSVLDIDKPVKEVIKTDMTHTISHEEITSLTNQFMERLVQEIDNNYKVIDFQTKEELLKQFEGISSRELALEYIDFYYMEEGNDLYIVPTELPPWIETDQDYDVVQIADDKVKVIQDITMDLYGAYMIEVEFTFCDNWKITNVHYVNHEQDGQAEESPVL